MLRLAATALLAVPSASAPAAGMIVHADAPIAHISPYMTGAGIEDVNHELIGGLSTQLIWGESFEEPPISNVTQDPFHVSSSRGVSARGTNSHPTWLPTAASGPHCEFEVVKNIAAKTGLQSQFVAGAGCGVRNRGLDFGGHSFLAGEAYGGHFFAKGDTASTVSVSLVNWSSNKTLASQTISILTGSSAWAMQNFSLKASAGTNCSTVEVGADEFLTCAKNAENLCPICTGEFHITVLSGAVLLDQVFLEQTSLRFADQPTRSSVVSLIKDTMGFGVLRNGGSQCNAEGYRWKRFRGPAYDRQPYDGVWYKEFASPGWRIFEFLNMCEAADIHPVVTMDNKETPEDMADFVEYCYGAAESTTWGSVRKNDGHAEPYKKFWVEIGNEQGLTDSLVHDVVAVSGAMQAKAKELKLPFNLSFVVGGNGWVPKAFTPMMEALAAGTPTGTDVSDWYFDFHIGGDSLDVGGDWAVLNIAKQYLAEHESKIRGVCLEENGGLHGLQRALGHAARSNRLHCLGDFMRAETPANGLQVLGHNDNSWDQGQVFIMPNMSYLAPHGASQIMISQTYGDATVTVTMPSSLEHTTFDVMATRNMTHLTARVVNLANDSVTTSLQFEGCAPLGATARLLTLAGYGANDELLKSQNFPGDTQKVWPMPSTSAVSSTTGLSHTFGAYTFTTVTVDCKPGLAKSAAAIKAMQATSSCSFVPPPPPSPPPPPPAPFSWAGRTMVPSAANGWNVSGAALHWTDARAHGRAYVKGSLLPIVGKIYAAVNLTFPSSGPTGPTSMLLRFDTADKNLGPGADDFSGYEVAIAPGHASLGYHAHDYTALDSTGVALVLGKPLLFRVELEQSPTSLNFTYTVDGRTVATFAHTDAERIKLVAGGGVAVRGFSGLASFEGLEYGTL